VVVHMYDDTSMVGVFMRALEKFVVGNDHLFSFSEFGSIEI